MLTLWEDNIPREVRKPRIVGSFLAHIVIDAIRSSFGDMFYLLTTVNNPSRPPQSLFSLGPHWASYALISGYFLSMSFDADIPFMTAVSCGV